MPKMPTMKTLSTILFILLLISASLNWIQYDSGRKQENFRYADNLSFQNAIASERAKSLAADSAIDAINEKMTLDKGRDSVALAGLKQANSRLTRKIAQIRPQVDIVADSVPVVEVYLQLSDSLILAKDSIIAHQALTHAAEVVDLQAIIREMGKKVESEMATGELWKQTAQDAQSDANREKRKAKVWRNVAYGLGVVAVILSLK